MEAKRLSEERMEYFKALCDNGYGFTGPKVEELFQHIAALEAENKGLRDEAAFKGRVLSHIRDLFDGEYGDIISRAEDSVMDDIAAEKRKANKSPEGVTR